MAISFVGVASLATRNTNGSFTLSKPSGVTSGDFMIAVVANWPGLGGEEMTVTPPVGWTTSDGGYQYASNGTTRMVVMVRTAGASEPSSWNGSYSGTEDVEVTIVAAYRGATGIVESEVDVRGSATSYSVGSVSNPSASNWRVTVGAYVAGSKSYAIQSNESSLRKRDGFYSSSVERAVEAGIWDSNGTVSTGSHSRTISRSSTWSSSVAWIGILGANTTTLTASLSAEVPLPTMSAAGSLGYAAVVDVDMPSMPTVTMAGIASPPAGPLDVLVVPVVTVAAAHHASGVFAVLVVPVVDVEGETRKFGIRVVTPEAESRVTTPRIGAVD